MFASTLAGVTTIKCSDDFFSAFSMWWVRVFRSVLCVRGRGGGVTLVRIGFFSGTLVHPMAVGMVLPISGIFFKRRARRRGGPFGALCLLRKMVKGCAS